MKKIISLFLLSVLSCSLLSGCGNSSDITNIPSMTLDEVAGSRLLATTTGNVASEIYNYVSDRIVVDGSKLIDVSAEDDRNITNLLANINTQLSGKGGNVLTDEYANYLLLEFAKTPYEWAQSNRDIIGFDPASRLYFVDVTYRTTGTYKSVVPDSKIANGDPEGDLLKQKRYADYMTMLTYKTRGHEDYQTMYNTFVNRWGNIQDIFDEQQGVSLYERTLAKGSASGGIGKLTYSGLVSDNTLAKGATMTVRYVLKYALNLGEETDLSVEALYVKSYELDNYEQILKSYRLEDAAALEVLKPFIDQLILSYNKCVEESNHIGLFKLFNDYSTIDKYYDEIRDYTYNSIGGYTYKILERKNEGKEVVVQVNRINQIRARGAEMSLPTYDETLIFNIVLGTQDNIMLKDIYLVKQELIGEPLSVIKNVTGISDQIQYSDVAFSAVNKEAVEKLLADFSKLVTNGDYTSNEFLRVVDLGVSENTLNRMVDTMQAITPERKSMYIVSWNTKTNVYCSVTVREVFECENGNFDTEAVIDMGNRNGEWKVVNYTRTLNIKTNDTEVDTSNAFCVDERTTEGDTTVIEGDTNKNDVEIVTPVENTPEPTPTPETSIDEEPVESTELTNNGDTGDNSESDVPDAPVESAESSDNTVDTSVESDGESSDFS